MLCIPFSIAKVVFKNFYIIGVIISCVNITFNNSSIIAKILTKKNYCATITLVDKLYFFKDYGGYEMKKFLLLVAAVSVVFGLVACGEKDVKPTTSGETTPAPVAEKSGEDTPVVTPVEESGEQVGVGNTDEGMVVLALERYFQETYGDEVEEFIPTNIKVYSPEEVEANEAIKAHDIKEGDIPFEVEYELLIKEGVEDMMKFTASTGEVDGQKIINKSNLGIARNNGEAGYSIDAFGTGW